MIMLNFKSKSKLIIMAILSFYILLMSNYSLANDYSMTLSDTTDVIGVQNDVSKWIQPNTPIYFEDLRDNRALICNGHGIPLPSRKSNSNPLKDATLETGLVIRVPLFVDQDEEVYVRTDTGEYDSRA